MVDLEELVVGQVDHVEVAVGGIERNAVDDVFANLQCDRRPHARNQIGRWSRLIPGRRGLDDLSCRRIEQVQIPRRRIERHTARVGRPRSREVRGAHRHPASVIEAGSAQQFSRRGVVVVEDDSLLGGIERYGNRVVGCAGQSGGRQLVFGQREAESSSSEGLGLFSALQHDECFFARQEDQAHRPRHLVLGGQDPAELQQIAARFRGRIRLRQGGSRWGGGEARWGEGGPRLGG